MTVKVLGVEEIEIDCLTDFPGNARRGALGVVRESIREHGQFRPLVVRRRDRKPDQILAGHTTRDALVAERYTTARCEILSCSDDEARAINLVDNRSQELAGWDSEALIAQLDMFGGDFTGVGFTAVDVDKLRLKGMPEPGDASVDEDDEGGMWGVVVEVDSEAEQAELLDELAGRGLKVRALIQ